MGYEEIVDRSPEELIARLLAGQAGPLSVPAEPERFIQLLEEHGVAAVLADALQRRDPGEEGWTGIAERLLNTRRQWLARNIYLLGRLQAVQELLRRAGIPSIVLKGGCLLSVLYPDFGLRPLGDIDLLIRGRDLDRILELLGRDGWEIPSDDQQAFWRRNFYHLFVESRDAFGAVFELHWDLEKEFRHAIRLEELWERSVVFHLEGEAYRRLANEDLMIHLMTHLAHHYFRPRLIWAHDIQRLARTAKIDWNRVLARAERWRLRLPVYYAVRYVEKLFPGAIPPEVQAAARVSPIRRGLLHMVTTADPLHLTVPMERPLLRLPFSLYFIEKPGDVIRFLWRNLGPKWRRHRDRRGNLSG